MMSLQLPLIDPPRPTVDHADVRALLDVLTGRGWMTAAQILAFAAGRDRRWTDRALRAIKHASHGSIISGQKGYKLTSQATLSEVQEAAGWLRSQAREMLAASMDIDRAYHRRLFAVAPAREGELPL